MESLDNAFISLDTPISPDSPPALSPSLPPTLDDDVVLAPLANLCVPTFTPNTDFDFDLYSLCVHSLSSASSSHFAFPTISFMTSALASMMSLYNALLDSGCMHHIIRDHALFSNYVSSSISVGTANCGSLEALGTGGYPYHDHHVVFTLRSCLYAPAAPINLLSVDALVKHGMSCLFSPGGFSLPMIILYYLGLNLLLLLQITCHFCSWNFLLLFLLFLQLLSWLMLSLLLLLFLCLLSWNLPSLVLNLILCSGIGALVILVWKLLRLH